MGRWTEKRRRKGGEEEEKEGTKRTVNSTMCEWTRWRGARRWRGGRRRRRRRRRAGRLRKRRGIEVEGQREELLRATRI